MSSSRNRDRGDVHRGLQDAKLKQQTEEMLQDRGLQHLKSNKKKKKKTKKKKDHLCESRELINSKEVCSIQSFESKFDSQTAMGMPATLLLTSIGEILGRETKIASVQKLQQEHEHIMTYNTHWNDLWCYCCCCSCCCTSRLRLLLLSSAPNNSRSTIKHVCISTEDHPEKRTASCQHTFVCVHMPSFHCKAHITERLSIQQQAQEILRQRLEWLFFQSIH